MMEKFWRIALAVGGLAAVGAFTFWSLYKKWLSLPIFSKLSPDQTFIIMIIFLIFTFIAMIILVVAYFAKSNYSRTDVINGQDATKHVLNSKQVPSNAQELFLVGAGVGNRLAMLPIPSGTDENDGLNDFISALSRLKISTHPIIRPIWQARKLLDKAGAELIPPQKEHAYLEAYFDAMKKIPQLIRDSFSVDQYNWFQFGMLLYEISTAKFLQKKSLAKDNGIIPEAIALKALMETMELPGEISIKVQDYLLAASKGADKATILLKANLIAQSIYAWI